MNLLARWTQRIIIGVVALAAIWLIVTQVFEPLNERLPIYVALVLTYIVSAYIILPRIVQVTFAIVRRGRIPRVSRAGDGLPADPVNLLLVGSEHDLVSAFTKAGWCEADALGIRSASKIIFATLFNKPYHCAPFKPLFLFARRQDHGFQQPIGKSPRKRHHIRFWAANLNPDADPADFKYWNTKHKIDPSKPLIWVGAATEDIGIGLTALTAQITHRTDKDIDEEREYILGSLRGVSAITDEHYVDSDRTVEGKYISDGRILTATLLPQPVPMM
jgi:LssY C-terminus